MMMTIKKSMMKLKVLGILNPKSRVKLEEEEEKEGDGEEEEEEEERLAKGSKGGCFRLYTWKRGFTRKEEEMGPEGEKGEENDEEAETEGEGDSLSSFIAFIFFSPFTVLMFEQRAFFIWALSQLFMPHRTNTRFRLAYF